MYYQNGGYMQDLNYYNQNPNYGFNPYMSNNFQMQNMTAQIPMQTQNLNAMYPAVYRIVSPVVSQILANSNTGYLSEDALNNITDTIYSIIDKDINLSSNSSRVSNTDPSTSADSNSSNNSNNYGRNSQVSNTSNSNSTITANNTQNSLLRDLIKILILNEIIFRRKHPNLVNTNMQNTRMMM